MVDFVNNQLLRYDRQMRINAWGEEGQKKVKESKVFIVGAGGLGSPVAYYLAVAGVGEIHICDSDKVTVSNLNRQILHTDADLGHNKAESAVKTLIGFNPTIEVIAHQEHLDQNNLERILSEPDIIVDCLDNFETRYLLNAYCLQNGIPFVHGAVWSWTGQMTFIHVPGTPCLRCIFPQAPTGGSNFPVIGATPGVVGCLQAMEVLKFLTGIGSNLRGKLLVIEGEDMTFNTFELSPKPTCPACGHLRRQPPESL